jgi:hypothetical protein
LKAIDAWAAKQKPPVTRPEAIRCILALGLKAKGKITNWSLKQRLSSGFGSAPRYWRWPSIGVALKKFMVASDNHQRQSSQTLKSPNLLE